MQRVYIDEKENAQVPRRYSFMITQHLQGLLIIASPKKCSNFATVF